MLMYPLFLQVCLCLLVLMTISSILALTDDINSLEDEDQDFITVVNQLKKGSRRANAELEKIANEAQHFVNHVTKIINYPYEVLKEYVLNNDILSQLSTDKTQDYCLSNEEKKRIPVLFEYYAKDCISKKVHHIYELKQYSEDMLEMAGKDDQDEKELREEHLSEYNRFEIVQYLAETVQLKKTTVHWVRNLMMLWKNDWTIALGMVDLDWSESAKNEGPAVACINQVLTGPIMKLHLEDYCHPSYPVKRSTSRPVALQIPLQARQA